MSPRRRLFVAGLVLLLGLSFAVVAVALVRSSDRPDLVGQDRPGPVLLVPGYGGSVVALDRLAAALRAAGRDATVVGLPGDGAGPLEDQATALGTAAQAALDAGAPSVDVVGYSAGGVVARLWVAEHGGTDQARRVVTLGSPQHGTDVAGLAAVLAPDSCPAACQELAPDSPLLGRLDRGDETPAGPLWVSIWTTERPGRHAAGERLARRRARPGGAGRLPGTSGRPRRAAHRPGGAGAGAGRARGRSAVRSAQLPGVTAATAAQLVTSRVVNAAQASPRNTTA